VSAFRIGLLPPTALLKRRVAQVSITTTLGAPGRFETWEEAPKIADFVKWTQPKSCAAKSQ
jgi:hypothetical protein